MGGIKVSIRRKKEKSICDYQCSAKKLTVPPPSRSCLFFISLSARVSSLPVEPCCYLSARMRVCFIFISFFSDQKQLQPLSARLHTHTHARARTPPAVSAAVTLRRSHNSSLSLTHIYTPLQLPRQMLQIVSYQPIRHDPSHSPSIFLHKACLPAAPCTVDCVCRTQKTQVA